MKATVWEYKQIQTLNRLCVDAMNTMGRDGWELVTSAQYDGYTVYTFKRPRID